MSRIIDETTTLVKTTRQDFTKPRISRRGGIGPVQPQWDDIATYSAEWYARFRDWHGARFPHADQVTRNNLAMLSGLEPTNLLESNALAEKEGFEPSFPAKRHGNRLGFPSASRRHDA